MSGKIFMFCPDFKPPSGGTKRVYHLTEVLRRHGFDACVMHTRPGFRLNWVGIDVPIVYMRDSLGRVKIEDILVIPEGWPHIMELTVSLPCKKIAFAMSVEYILPKLPSGVTWRDFGIRQAITTTPGVAHFVEVVMQIPVYIIGSSIDCSFFHFVPEKKRKLIVYPGRAKGNRKEAEIIYRILGMLNSVFNDYELLPVTDLSLPDYRDVLMQAEYYLTLMPRWANND